MKPMPGVGSGSRMKQPTSLIEMVHQFQQAKSLEECHAHARSIVLRLNRYLRVFLLGRCDRDNVEDIIQVIETKIFSKLMDFEGDSDGDFLAWVRKIARNKAIEQYRRQCRNPATPNAEEPTEEMFSGASRQLPDGDQLHSRAVEIVARLRQLDPLCVERLWLRFVDGYTIKEMAAQFGVKYDAMRLRIDRCGEKLQSLAKREKMI